MEQSYNQHIQQQVTTLFQAMEQRVAPEEMERIKAAYAVNGNPDIFGIVFRRHLSVAVYITDQSRNADQ